MASPGLLAGGNIAELQKKLPYAVITNPIGPYSGAVNDGVTDNTLVIQAWVDWVEANLDKTRIVFIPAGNPGFVTNGIVTKSVSIVGEDPTRALLGRVQFGSRLIHKVGSTVPLIDMLGGGTIGTATQGWERVQNLVLQGRQKANISVPKRSIVSAADRTHFTVAIGDLPAAPAAPTQFPFYGLCLFFDAQGQRLGSGIVQSVNGGTGEVTLKTGTDNYTGITGSGNLLTATEKVAFSALATYDVGWNFTITNSPDSTMIGPPAIRTAGLTKFLDMVDMRDFHCSVVMQENILHIGRIWSHNHVMAGIAARAPGIGADVWAENVFCQGRGYEGYGEPGRSIGVIDPYAMYSLCGLWVLPSTSHFNDVTVESSMHGIIDSGGGDTHFDYLNVDGAWKEPIITWGGQWNSGTASALISIGYFQARTLQAQYVGNFTAPAGTYPNGERTIIGIMATDGPRRWTVSTLVANRFFQDSPAAFDYASVYKITGAPGNGQHEVTIRSIPYQGAVTTKGIPRGTSALPGAYAFVSKAPYLPTVQAVVANGGRITRFEVERDMLIPNLVFAVQVAAGSNDNVDVGIYNADGSQLVHSGAVAGKLNSLGTKIVPITPTMLRAGRFYYFALSVGAIGTTAATLAALTPASLQASQLWGTTLGLIETDTAAAVHPLPATWVIGALSSVSFLGAVLE